MQIEKHNVNIYPDFQILMVLDVWEHAYYPRLQKRTSQICRSFLEPCQLGQSQQKPKPSKIGNPTFPF